MAGIVQAAMMYHDCRGAKVLCTVLVSGGDPDGYGTSLAVVYGGLLAPRVPAQDLLLEPRSANTWQNAKFTQPMLHAVSPARVWLVIVRVPHAPGAGVFRAFRYRADSSARRDYIQIVPQWTPSAINFAMMDLGLHEYVGLLRFRVYDAMGWNERIAGRLHP